MAVTFLWSLVRDAGIVATTAAAMVAVVGQGTAAADVTNHVAVCHSTDVAGVETDNCVGNPGYDNSLNGWPQVWVEPRFWFGIGIG